MTSEPRAHDRAPIELPHNVRMEILGAVLLGIFLSALDQTIVGTALPRIVTDLHGNDVYVWAFTAYLLTATVSAGRCTASCPTSSGGGRSSSSG